MPYPSLLLVLGLTLRSPHDDKDQISRLAKDSSPPHPPLPTTNQPPTHHPTSASHPAPLQKDSTTKKRRYTIIPQPDEDLPRIPEHPPRSRYPYVLLSLFLLSLTSSPPPLRPKVIPHSSLPTPPSPVPFKLYDAVLSHSASTSSVQSMSKSADEEMEKFIPMLNDYLKRAFPLLPISI
jgi:hypothetical protein